jgi:hypothetical protein
MPFHLLAANLRRGNPFQLGRPLSIKRLRCAFLGASRKYVLDSYMRVLPAMGLLYFAAGSIRGVISCYGWNQRIPHRRPVGLADDSGNPPVVIAIGHRPAPPGKYLYRNIIDPNPHVRSYWNRCFHSTSLHSISREDKYGKTEFVYGMSWP